MTSSANELGAILVVEIGSLVTRVTLIDAVDGESRVIGRAETHSSIEAPYNSASYAVLEAAAQITEITGRQIMRDGQILLQQNDEGDGVNHVLVTTSAAGHLALVVVAVASDISARSALHATRSTYTTVLQTITLDDVAAQPHASHDNASWIERQVQTLLDLQPDAILIAGGLEDGAVNIVNRLAHIVGLTAMRLSVDTSGQLRQTVTARPVVYAGNSTARERVVDALSDRAEVFVVDNVRPTLDVERLAHAREELDRLYIKHVLPQLPNLGSLRRLSKRPVTTVCAVEGVMARFLAERDERRVLLVDIGAANSSAFFASPGEFYPAVLGAHGTGYGLTVVLERGVQRVARWLPFAISDEELTHRLLNKLLRPQNIPSTREDLLIEHAVLREVLTLTVEALADEHPQLDYDWLIAGGGVLSHTPAPSLAVLALLDALQPTLLQDQPVIDMHLDTLGLVPACGALAHLSQEAAVDVFDRDFMRNTPLASCVVPLGGGQAGAIALEAELVTTGGRTQRITVHHGEIARLPLPQGRYGQLTLRPAAGVRIGRGQPGVEVSSDLAAIRGSIVGVVIDARGRPLTLADNPDKRLQQTWEWMVALGAERGPNPYITADDTTSTAPSNIPPAPVIVEPAGSVAATVPPPPSNGATVEQPAATALPPPNDTDSGAISESAVATDSGQRGRRISLEELAAQEQLTAPTAPALPEPPPAPGTLEGDLAKLRQTVAEPERRGFFKRRKKD